MRAILSLCSQDSSAARSQYWLRIQTETFLYIKSSPSQCLFFYSSQSTLARPPDWWDKLSPPCYGLASPCVFQMAPGTWCNQALRGQCECVWSCKPAISSAADDQVGGEDDLWAVQKGHRSTPPYGEKASLLGFKKDPDRDVTEWLSEWLSELSAHSLVLWRCCISIKLCDIKNTAGMLSISLSTRSPCG